MSSTAHECTVGNIADDHEAIELVDLELVKWSPSYCSTKCGDDHEVSSHQGDESEYDTAPESVPLEDDEEDRPRDSKEAGKGSQFEPTELCLIPKDKRAGRGKGRVDRWQRVEEEQAMSVTLISSPEDEQHGESRVRMTFQGQNGQEGVFKGTIVPYYQRLRFSPPIQTAHGGLISEGIIHHCPGDEAETVAKEGLRDGTDISFYIERESTDGGQTVEVVTRQTKIGVAWWKCWQVARETNLSAWSGHTSIRDTAIDPSDKLFRLWKGTASVNSLERYVVLEGSDQKTSRMSDLIFLPKSVRGNTETWTMDGTYDVSYLLGAPISRGIPGKSKNTDQTRETDVPITGANDGPKAHTMSSAADVSAQSTGFRSPDSAGPNLKTEQTVCSETVESTGRGSAPRVPRKLQKKQKAHKDPPPIPGCPDCATQCEFCPSIGVRSNQRNHALCL